jgi:hypothetical protein
MPVMSLNAIDATTDESKAERNMTSPTDAVIMAVIMDGPFDANHATMIRDKGRPPPTSPTNVDDTLDAINASVESRRI